MKTIYGVVSLGLLVLSQSNSFAADCECSKPDWPNLAAYRAKNKMLNLNRLSESRVVFMGDSITEFWDQPQQKFFANINFINRGISGQTTPQMLLRFRQDVIDLKPKVVVILAGTNDIAENTGPITLEEIAGNIASMAVLARAQGIKVVLSAVLPAKAFYWIPEIQPAQKIVALNRMIQAIARRHGFGYIDYHTPMADPDLGLDKRFSDDGVHPNAAGYEVMQGLVEKAVAKMHAKSR